MKNYVILSKNEATGIAYFYNFADGCVYQDNQGKLKETAGWGASLGAFAGMVCMGGLGALGSMKLVSLAPFLCAASGWILGLITYALLNRMSYFPPESRQVLGIEQIRMLYEAGAAYRRSYFWMSIGFGVFSIGAAAFLFVVQEWALVICVILSWWVMGVMVWAIRPVLQIRLRKCLYQ